MSPLALAIALNATMALGGFCGLLRWHACQELLRILASVLACALVVVLCNGR